MWLIPYAPEVDFPIQRIASHWLLLQSWVPDIAYILSYNGVAWSISTEAFFYLTFPLFLLGGLRNFWWKYVTTIVMTALALWGMTHIAAHPEWSKFVNTHNLSHFNPFMRLLEFASGMATAYLFMSTRVRSVKLFQISQWPVVLQTGLELTALSLAASSFYILKWLGYYTWISNDLGLGGEVSYWLVYCGGMPFHAFCIFVFAQSNGWLGRLFSTKLMIFLGEISFALYMVHRLIILLLIKTFWVGSTLPYWAIISSSLFLSLGVSALLFLLVEMPMKNLLLKCYDLNLADRALWYLIRFFKRRVAYASIAMIAIPIVLMSWSKSNRPPELTVDQVVEKFPTTGINFDNKVQLIAWEFEEQRMGTEVTLVWDAEKPTLFRHEYQLVGSPYARKGKCYVKDGPTLQRFFIHKSHWDKGESFDLKIWRGKKLLSANSNIAAGGQAKPTTSYRMAVRPEESGTIIR